MENPIELTEEKKIYYTTIVNLTDGKKSVDLQGIDIYVNVVYVS